MINTKGRLRPPNWARWLITREEDNRYWYANNDKMSCIVGGKEYGPEPNSKEEMDGYIAGVYGCKCTPVNVLLDNK